MNYLLIPDEQFNEVARSGDLETPIDRFYDLVMAVFHNSVQEALQQHSKHPDRQPNSGLVRNAAAWLQETIMPDVSQQDIADRISDWIIAQSTDSATNDPDEVTSWQPSQSIFAMFM